MVLSKYDLFIYFLLLYHNQDHCPSWTLSFLNYYHTSLRNMGLYTSLAFAALAYSRYHRDKLFLINITLLLVSIIFTTLSITIGTFLLEDVAATKTEMPMVAKWLIIPKIIIYTNIAVCASTLYVFYTQF